MLPALLIAIAIVSAVLLVRASQRRERKARAALPGGCRDRAIAVRRFDEIDAAVRRARCVCGAVVNAAGEGAERHGLQRFRVVRCECPRCGAVTRLWFDVTAALA